MKPRPRPSSLQTPAELLVHLVKALGGSDKHLRDIRSMLEVSAGEIDVARIDERAAALGLAEAWRRVRAEPENP